jgi:group I intron endonuclease
MLQAAKYFIAAPNHLAYYLHLDDPKVVRALRYRFKGKAIIYGFRCLVDGKMYIGSTLTPGLRFHSHLVTGLDSNINLQEAIAKYGVHMFTGYVFQLVAIPRALSTAEARVFLSKVEQTYINKFPKAQLYNSINSSNG